MTGIEITKLILILCMAVIFYVGLRSMLDYAEERYYEKRQREWEELWKNAGGEMSFSIPDWEATPGKLEAEAAEELNERASTDEEEENHQVGAN